MGVFLRAYRNQAGQRGRTRTKRNLAGQFQRQKLGHVSSLLRACPPRSLPAVASALSLQLDGLVSVPPGELEAFPHVLFFCLHQSSFEPSTPALHLTNPTPISGLR